MTRSLPSAAIPAILRIALVIVLIVTLCGTVTAATAPVNRLVLSTAPTLLSVDSTPQGALVVIDGTRAGVTPLQKYSVSPGDHTLFLALSGYQNQTASVTILRGQDLAVSYTMTANRRVIAPELARVVRTLPPQISVITAIPVAGPSPGTEPWITGAVSSGTLTCTDPGNTIVFQGSSGNVSNGTVITFTILNMPGGEIGGLPSAGIVLGTTRVQGDKSWKFTWNGGVPGHVLTPGESYFVRASLSPANYIRFGILYQCQPGDQWISGSMSGSSITCTQPTATVTLSGSSGNLSGGTPLTVAIYDYPGAATRILPDTGVLLGSTLLQPDGTWKFIWNGAVPGYKLTAGDSYLIRVKRTESDFLKFGILYQCQPANIPAALQNPVPASGLQPVAVSGKLVQQVVAAGDSSGQGTSGGSPQNGEPVAVIPHLNPQPDPPAPLQSLYNFLNSLFGGSRTAPK